MESARSIVVTGAVVGADLAAVVAGVEDGAVVGSRDVDVGEVTAAVGAGVGVGGVMVPAGAVAVGVDVAVGVPVTVGMGVRVAAAVVTDTRV